jgi:peptidyl-prolyl cis-trans isomerase SurA
MVAYFFLPYCFRRKDPMAPSQAQAIRRDPRMGYLFRSAIGTALVLAAAFGVAACAKHAPLGGADSPLFPLALTPEDKAVVVAKVNGADITNYSLVDMMNRMGLMNQRLSQPEPLEATRKKALDQLVLQELAIQEAVRQGLSVEDPVIDRAMEMIITKLGHEEGYRDFLKTQHLTPAEFRSQVERSLLVQQILVNEVSKKVRVEESAVRQEYDLSPALFSAPEKISVVDIAVSLSLGEQAAAAKAQELLSSIDKGKDKEAQPPASDATISIRNITLEKEKEPALYDAARKLQVGEHSELLRTKDSMHVIKLIEYTPGRQKSYEEVRDSIEGKLKSAALVKRRQEWEQQLRKDAKIEVLAAPDKQAGKRP